jgi:hypothetical protein
LPWSNGILTIINVQVMNETFFNWQKGHGGVLALNASLPFTFRKSVVLIVLLSSLISYELEIDLDTVDLPIGLFKVGGSRA